MRPTPSRLLPPNGSTACCADADTRMACRGEFESYRATRDRAARNELALRHEWLAVRLARRLAQRGQPADDLTQVAWIGLIKAIERFDTDRGVAFPAFATPTIVGELKRHFRDHSWDLVVPRRAKELRNSIGAGADVLHQRLGRAPRPAELAAYLGVSREAVIETLAAMSAHRARSLHPLPGRPALDGHTDDPRWTDQVDARVAAVAAVSTLIARDRMILYWRFYDDRTQSEIAERIGLSQVQVSRRLTACLAELRRTLGPLAAADGH